MGILDDAIKEHLELKRQHGAGESELKQLEDEAFGAAERPGMEEASPDPLAEAPTQFMSQPEGQEAESVADEPAPAAEASARRQPPAEIADLQEPPAPPEEPAEEQAPAMEQEAVPEPEPQAGPSTDEREAIAEQPTEMYDVEEELGGEEDEEDELDNDDFFDEKRLSDELNQALEAPAEVEEEIEPEEEPATEAALPDRHEEDVLEETPDFLEEAPEDDQLWFEQKPPKDFDFDD
jgi:hypothetical protein